jgi:Skp family chaperone for outer membrane proteins
MKIDLRSAAAIAVLLAAALALQASGQDKSFDLALPGLAQDKPAGARTGVLNLRDCMDKSRNRWIADIEQELQKMQEAESGRATDLNPQERARIRTKILDLSNKRRLEVYNEVVRLSGAVARERGFDLVQRVDRMPVIESGDTDLLAQIDRRGIVHYEPAIDITGEVVERLNKDHAARKK